MELICSRSETLRQRIDQIKECCGKYDIDVTVKQIYDVEKLSALQFDVSKYYILLLDADLVDLLERCSRAVSKIIKITSKPHKLVFMKHVDEDKFQELMEIMFIKPDLHCAYTAEEIVKFYQRSSKLPSESDEITNMATEIQCMSLENTEQLSVASLSNQPDSVTSNVIYSRRTERDPVESRHSFSSDDCAENKSRGNENLAPMSHGGQNINGNQEPCDHRTNKRFPGNSQSVQTQNLYPTLPNQSVMSTYVEACMSQGQLQSQLLHRPEHMSVCHQSFPSSGPEAMQCLSGRGHGCRCRLCPSHLQHSASDPMFSTNHSRSFTGSETGKPVNNVNFRPEILNLNRQFNPGYEPNIQSAGSDNRAVSCSRCGNSFGSKQEQSEIGPSTLQYNSAGGASGMIEKEYISCDSVSILELKSEVVEKIRDTLDYGEQYNWKKLADLHKWPFGKIYKLEQMWKNRKIDSPFMHLIEEFQPYTLYQLKQDLQQIPRKDLLQWLEECHSKDLLFHT